MYVPPHFAAPDDAAALDLIDANGLADLVALCDGELLTTPVPMLVDRVAGSTTPLGSLVGHLARANTLWRAIGAGVPAVAMFRGADGYVSPSWYPSKQTDGGRVVPTWDYQAVHVHGELVLHDDPGWVLDLVTRLTDHNESHRPEPWAVSDAPDGFVAGRLKAVVGIEVRISHVEAKWKLSQNRPGTDRRGVVDGFRAIGDHRLAEVVESATARVVDR